MLICAIEILNIIIFESQKIAIPFRFKGCLIRTLREYENIVHTLSRKKRKWKVTE